MPSTSSTAVSATCICNATCRDARMHDRRNQRQQPSHPQSRSIIHFWEQPSEPVAHQRAGRRIERSRQVRHRSRQHGRQNQSLQANAHVIDDKCHERLVAFLRCACDIVYRIKRGQCRRQLRETTRTEPRPKSRSSPTPSLPTCGFYAQHSAARSSDRRHAWRAIKTRRRTARTKT